MYKNPFAPPLSSQPQRPYKLIGRAEEAQRFSSFETPPPSDRQNEQFSDFETSRQKQVNLKGAQGSVKKQHSHILVQQLPLQVQKSASQKKKNNRNSSLQVQDTAREHYQNKTDSRKRKSSETSKQKQNCSMRFNYMQKIEKHLSTIRQDGQQEERESNFQYRCNSYSNLNHFDIGKDYMQNCRESLYLESNIAVIEQQRLEIIRLRQDNNYLKDRIIRLEQEIRIKDKQISRRQGQILAERLNNVNNQQNYNSTRKQAKIKLFEEISALQLRCREMKEQMKQYKQKQQKILNQIIREKQQVKIENILLKTSHEYQIKFSQVFLNMVEKLPIVLDPKWSKKRKIAVGWKVVKHFVKKALKLGIHPPSICQNMDEA